LKSNREDANNPGIRRKNRLKCLRREQKEEMRTGEGGAGEGGAG